MQTKSARIIASALFAVMAGGVPVFAQDTAQDTVQDSRAVSFSGMIGVGYAPTYEGSDTSDALAVFDFNASFAGGRFFVGTRGIGFAPILTDALTVRLALSYGGGRAVKDDPARLAGLGDIDDEALALLTADYRMGQFGLGAEVTGGADYGTTAKFSLSTGVECTDRITVGGEINATYADGQHMQQYFGVSGAQAGASGKAAYSAGSGLKSVGISMGATYALTDTMSIEIGAEHQQLLEDAKNSPITLDASQTFAFLGVSAHF
jgi:MipA family protein